MTVTSLRARFASALALAVRIAPGAAEALAVISGYEAALPSGRFDVARGFMAPAPMLIANGQVRGHRSSRPAA